MRQWSLSLFMLCFSMSWAIFAAPTEPVQLFSVPIIAASLVTELLSRFNYVFKGKPTTTKKDLSLFPRKIFDSSLLNNSTFHWSWSCTGDAFSRLCLFSWICPEWCSCCVPIFYTSLIPWDDMSAWLESAKRTLMQTENITSESTRWGLKKMTSILMFVSLFCGFYYFSFNEQNCTSGPIQRLTRRDFWFFR